MPFVIDVRLSLHTLPFECACPIMHLSVSSAGGECDSEIITCELSRAGWCLLCGWFKHIFKSCLNKEIYFTLTTNQPWSSNENGEVGTDFDIERAGNMSHSYADTHARTPTPLDGCIRTWITWKLRWRLWTTFNNFISFFKVIFLKEGCVATLTDNLDRHWFFLFFHLRTKKSAWDVINQFGGCARFESLICCIVFTLKK